MPDMDDPVIAGFPPVSAGGPSRAVAGKRNLGGELLAVTATPVVPGVVVLSAHGEVDQSTSPLLEDRLLAYQHGTVRRMIVDLNGVRFLSASGLAVLVTVKHAAAAAGIKLQLVARARSVLRPLTITGLYGLFDVSPDLKQALLAQAKAGAQICLIETARL